MVPTENTDNSKVPRPVPEITRSSTSVPATSGHSLWKFDYLAVLFVVVPYVIAVFHPGTAERGWVVRISNMVLVMQGSVTVKLVMAWPTSLTDRMHQTGKLKEPKEFDAAKNQFQEKKLTAAVIASLHARNYILFGVIAETAGVLIGGVVFVWMRSQLIAAGVDSALLSPANIMMFLLWGFIKLAVHVVQIYGGKDNAEVGDGTIPETIRPGKIKVGEAISANWKESPKKTSSSRLFVKDLKPRYLSHKRVKLGSTKYSDLVARPNEPIVAHSRILRPTPVYPNKRSGSPHLLKEVTVTVTPYPFSLLTREQKNSKIIKSSQAFREPSLSAIEENYETFLVSSSSNVPSTNESTHLVGRLDSLGKEELQGDQFHRETDTLSHNSLRPEVIDSIPSFLRTPRRKFSSI